MNRKTIIVTGGAQGIGKAIVYELAKEKHNVILNYNKSEKEAKQIKEELTQQGYQVDIYHADITKRAEIDKMVAYAVQKYKKIDVLINNAGISQIKTFAEITEKDWDQMINTNLKSIFNTSQAVLSSMLQEQNGLILNISSIWGVIGASCEVHYSTAKAGMNGFTKALAKELGPSNIRVNAIAPGIIDTNMNRKLSKEDVEQIKEGIPLEKIGKPEQIAKAVKWLIEDEYTTGQIISIDGGWGIN